MDTTTSNRRKLRTAYFAAASDSRFPNCRLTRDFCHPDCQDTGSQITGCNFFQENIMDKLLSIAARVLMAQIFVISGFTKITGYSGTQAYMAKMGVPGFLLPLVILTELGGGLALLFGIKTRWAAFALAGFTEGDCLDQDGMKTSFVLKVAVQALGRVFANQELAQVLQIGQAFQEKNALNQLVRLLHDPNGLLVIIVVQLFQSPVPEHAGMEKILVDGREFILESLVQHAQDLRIAFHVFLRFR
jgi:hypothetical protein